MTRPVSLPLATLLLIASLSRSPHAIGQTVSVEIAPHSPLTLQIPNHLPLRVGQPIRAHLLYPVYVGSTSVLPAGSVVFGQVTSLRPDRARRLRSRFNLNFTPFYRPVVRFDHLLLPDGTRLPIATDTATDGAPVVRLLAGRPHRRQNLFHREYDATVHLVHDQFDFFTGPGWSDRLLELFYHQLPWHPQRIERGTVWTVETTAPLAVPVQAEAALPSTPRALEQPAADPTGLLIQADLQEPLSSATAKAGQRIHATVAAPVFRADHTLAIPQGAVLVGTVTQDKPSRRFGRSGSLRFGFNQIVLPTGERQSLATRLAGTDASAAQGLALDAEGDITPVPQEKLIVPVILLGLASAPLDPDPGDNDEFFKNAGASNSLGLIGFITGVVVDDARVSAGFGYYGAALSISSRFVEHGPEVSFPRDTRIVLQTEPRDEPQPKPQSRTSKASVLRCPIVSPLRPTEDVPANPGSR
jgi:hypothetical protein